MRIVRLYSDADGTSHFEDIDIAMDRAEYAPPAPALDLSAAMRVTRAVLFSMPAGWFGDWHPTPHRQLYVNLSGRLEVRVSDGETRVFEPGDIALVEDVLEPGHTTRAIGDEPSTGIFVHLAEAERA